MTDPVIVTRPGAGTSVIPLVFDSPHSGLDYPADMKPSLEMNILRRSADTFVDKLFKGVDKLGAVMVEATFPRCYIDPNRTTEDIETTALADAWSGPVKPSIKTNRGTGLVWTKIHGVHPIYDRKLTAAEVQGRIDDYWMPYHDALTAEIERLYSDFGGIWHINCHSMPQRGDETTEDGPVDRADFVLGDRDGTTCAVEFTETVRDFLAGRGYDVAVNWPMKGVELVRKHGRPDENRHSLQIEINRRLYMDEIALAKNDRYDDTSAVIADMSAAIAAFVGENSAV